MEYYSALSPLVPLESEQDSDQDSMPDMYEAARGLDPMDPVDRYGDPDSDSLTNAEEMFSGTDPWVALASERDADGNGLPDIYEAAYVVAGGPSGDDDGDGLTNQVELKDGTPPNVDDRTLSDLDGDSLPDRFEVSNGLDPGRNDAGDNPDNDLADNLGEYRHGTSPLVLDPYTPKLKPGFLAMSVGQQVRLEVADAVPSLRFVAVPVSVAVVDHDGMVSAQGIGRGTIKLVDSNGFEAVSTVSVTEPLMVVPSKLELHEGETKPIEVSGGAPPYTIGVEPPALASVTGDNVKALSQGSGRILVHDSEGRTAHADLSVGGGAPVQGGCGCAAGAQNSGTSWLKLMFLSMLLIAVEGLVRRRR